MVESIVVMFLAASQPKKLPPPPKPTAIVVAQVTPEPTTQPARQAVLNKPQLSGDIWTKLGDCESGNDPAKNTGNGFYGAFQFTPGTWNGMGTGYSRADYAPYSVQLDAAKRLQARSGWGQWPGCASRLGLR